MQIDWLGYAAGTPNLYLALGNNPITRIDPNGAKWSWNGFFNGVYLGPTGMLIGGLTDSQDTAEVIVHAGNLITGGAFQTAIISASGKRGPCHDWYARFARCVEEYPDLVALLFGAIVGLRVPKTIPPASGASTKPIWEMRIIREIVGGPFYTLPILESLWLGRFFMVITLLEGAYMLGVFAYCTGRTTIDDPDGSLWLTPILENGIGPADPWLTPPTFLNLPSFHMR
jgi:hypothetical protein